MVPFYFLQLFFGDLATPTSHIFFLQIPALAGSTTFLRLTSLRFVPEFATILTQTASVLSFANPCYVVLGSAFKAPDWNCLSPYSANNQLGLHFPAMEKLSSCSVLG